MVRRKKQFIGFGFDPSESYHHFAVTIPENGGGPVIIEECFDWNQGEAVSSTKPPAVKIRLDRYRWDRIAEVAREQFNKRIRAAGHRSVSWSEGQPSILTPHFGKELTLLAWSTEDMDDSLLPNIISYWLGLEPEERWWLYTTVNATFTKAEIGKDRGWRKAIRIAFSENPVPEMPAERFIEEPEPIRLPQKDEEPIKTVAVPTAPRKKKRLASKKNSQINLFEE